jgi:steroid delta-isomerase-like uncharacterized protein
MRSSRFAIHLLISFSIVALLAARPSMYGQNLTDQESNKSVVRKVFEEGLTQGKWDIFEQIHASNFVAHGGSRDADRAEDLRSAKEWRQAFPDLVVTVNQMVAEGDRVAVYYTGRGTNTGTGQGLPATGKKAEGSGMTIFRLANGQIVEEWSVINELSMLRQLGLLPPTGQ